MNKRGLSRALSVLLLAVMVVSMLPVSAYADDTATWTKVDLSATTAGDTIAITMSKEGTTWVLPNTAEGSSGQPLASATGTIAGNKLTTDGSSGFAWTIMATEGGYNIFSGDSYLYVAATDVGVRIGATPGVWSVSSDGYLTAMDSKDTARYLGVYNNQDWRSYTNTTGEIAGQTLGFWKLDAAGTDPEPMETAATPTASPTDGEVVKGTQIAFSCATEGATISYKTGADEPWVTYAGPITVNEDTTFTVKATKDGMNDSAEASFAYTVKSEVVIYNASAEGVIGLQNELGAIMSCVSAAIADGKAIVENGGRVFTISVSGEDYSFESNGMYLASNDAEELFLTETLDDYAKWSLEKKTDGYVMYNKAAKYTFSDGGSAKVCIAYNSGSFSGGTYESADSAIFEMNFYPVADDTPVNQGIVNKPAIIFGTLPEAYVGQDYTFTFTIDAVFGVSGTPTAHIKASTTEETLVEQDGETYRITVPAGYLEGLETLTVQIIAFDTLGTPIEGDAVLTILDEPVFSDLTPNPGSQTGEDKRPVISAKVSNAGENPAVAMTVNGETVTPKYEDGVISYQPESDMADGSVSVAITVKRADGKEASKSWDFTVGTAEDHVHDYTWTITTEPTCTEPGVETGTCACGQTTTREITATGHNFSEWTSIYEATCTEDGLESRGCVCGEIETRTIKATGSHQFGEWETVRKPTDYLSGKEERVCSVCGEKETRKIPSLKGVESGDDNNILFWAVTFAVSGAGSAVILTKTRKKYKGMH